MSNITKTFMAALFASAIGSVLFSTGVAYAGPNCTTPPGGTRPICIGAAVGGVASGGPVVVQPSRQPRCYYLPTVADGAVNGLRKVCQYY